MSQLELFHHDSLADRRRTLVVGDVHGRFRLLEEALSLASYDPDVDTLICTGDLVDRGPQSAEVLDFFAGPRRLSVRGNHDAWALDWLGSGAAPSVWTMQGGAETQESLSRGPLHRFLEVLEEQDSFIEHVTPGGRRILVLHAGFDPTVSLDEQTDHTLQWDRDFFSVQRLARAIVCKWDRIFLGHTVVQRAALYGNVWALDTGAGRSGVLTVIDADTEEVWTSGTVAEHYRPSDRSPTRHLDRAG